MADALSRSHKFWHFYSGSWWTICDESSILQPSIWSEMFSCERHERYNLNRGNMLMHGHLRVHNPCTNGLLKAIHEYLPRLLLGLHDEWSIIQNCSYYMHDHTHTHMYMYIHMYNYIYIYIYVFNKKQSESQILPSRTWRWCRLKCLVKYE